MNLNGINQAQPSVMPKSKLLVQPQEQQTTQTEAAGAEKKPSDSGCLKNYFLGSVSFGGRPCSTSNFAIKKLKDVPCCCCGKPMLRETDLQECKSAVANSRGEKLAAVVDEYGKYMRADEKCVATILANKAKETGCDVSQAMKQTGSKVRELTGQYASGILTELNAMATEAFKSEDNPMAAVIAKAQEQIAKGGGLDRSTFVEQLGKAAGKLPEDLQGAIQDKAMDLPQTFNHVQRIYDKYQNRSADDIARRLFSTALTTAEHIHPHSLGGPDNTANYIAECAGCNNPRGNMSYSEWLKIHPEFPLKAQDHIEWFQQQVVDGKIDSRYDDYGVDVKATLSKESNGIIELKVLNPEKIQQLREAKKANQEADVTTEIANQENQEEEQPQKMRSRYR